MSKKNFNARANSLVSLIRKKQKVTIGEACLHLDVGPWQIERYAEAILSAFEDIRFDGQTFSTVVDSPRKFDLAQKEVDDYVRRMRGPEES